MLLRDREKLAADWLEARGVMMSRPGDGIEESGLKWHYGCCTGSHGGYGKRLRTAMQECLKCCGIGKWWKMGWVEKTNTFKGPKLSTLFRRACVKFQLGELI
jgi:hypothetical protein